ncbi:heterodisulfide reductase, subunit B [Candidatus Bathyarchaeota archaeon]|nr:heterodisulfide reductase, subunit B [Candidatus Bathyarchaeota archaeon]
MTRIAYYPGCTLKNTAKNFEESTLAISKALDIELVEPERWNCCGTVHALATDDVMHHLAPIRNMIRVEELAKNDQVDNKNMVTLCAMCYNTLKRANQAFNSDNDKKKKIRDIMYREDIEYSGKVEILHLLEILREHGWEKIKDVTHKPLKGLKIAPYYGCLLLRPRGIGVDNADNPKIMEDLFEALGAEVVDFSHKQKCCGSYNIVHMKEVVVDLAYNILNQAEKAGADVIATACPLCEYNLGPIQGKIQENYPNFETIPVLYFTQLMALAFGLSEEDAAVTGNTPDPKPILIEKGILKEEMN